MTEPFVETETDRTKSKWVAKTLKDFGRPKTTVRSLFYFAMSRGGSDYPICGSFVGEIRICRPYIESDGERLPKWVSKARAFGFIPKDAILEEIPGEHVILPKTSSFGTKSRIEIWINKSAFNELLIPICNKYEATLVSVSDKPSENAIASLIQRSEWPTTILCLSDLSIRGVSFCRELTNRIAEAKSPVEKNIRVISIGLQPEQVVQLKIPMVQGEKGTRDEQRNYEAYLKSYDLDKRKMAELDALEVYYPGGFAGFVEDALSRYAGVSEMEKESWLHDMKDGVQQSS